MIKVAGMGKSPARRKGDRSSEINFRRLRAWSEGDRGRRR